MQVSGGFRTFYLLHIFSSPHQRLKGRSSLETFTIRVYENEYRCLNKKNVGGLDQVSSSRVSPPRLFFKNLFWPGKINQDVSAAFPSNLS